MLVTLPLLYTLSTSIKVNANKLIQVSVHALTDYPFLFLLCSVMFSFTFVSGEYYDKFLSSILFFLLLLLVCLCVNQTCTNNNRSGVTQYIFTEELMCGTTTMNARNILKCVRELSLAFTWHVLVCE